VESWGLFQPILKTGINMLTFALQGAVQFSPVEKVARKFDMVFIYC
jgi:hypothetical protein